MISSFVMSLMYKFADKIFFSFIAQKQVMQAPPSEGPFLEKGVFVQQISKCKPPTLPYSLRNNFIDDFTARFPNHVWELAFFKTSSIMKTLPL